MTKEPCMSHRVSWIISCAPSAQWQHRMVWHHMQTSSKSELHIAFAFILMPVPNTEPLQHNCILIFFHLEPEQDGEMGWETLSLPTNLISDIFRIQIDIDMGGKHWEPRFLHVTKSVHLSWSQQCAGTNIIQSMASMESEFVWMSSSSSCEKIFHFQHCQHQEVATPVLAINSHRII